MVPSLPCQTVIIDRWYKVCYVRQLSQIDGIKSAMSGSCHRWMVPSLMSGRCHRYMVPSLPCQTVVIDRWYKVCYVRQLSQIDGIKSTMSDSCHRQMVPSLPCQAVVIDRWYKVCHVRQLSQMDGTKSHVRQLSQIYGTKPTMSDSCHQSSQPTGRIRKNRNMSSRYGESQEQCSNYHNSGDSRDISWARQCFLFTVEKLSICWPFPCVLCNAETDWLITGHSIRDDQ